MSSKEESSLRRTNKPTKIFYGMATNLLKHGFFIFREYLDMLIDFIFGWIWDGNKRELPPLEKKHSMLMLSAVELAEKIRNKELKSEDLVRACIERINAVNPILNAIVDERFEAALAEAKEIDKQIEEGLSEEYFKSKPFLGVPFTAKESHAVLGLLHTLGVQARRGLKATFDAECVKQVKAAGAIALAVTNIPEVNKWQETRNMVFGQTNNPYHPGRTTGGSSGGEAALAAAIACPISLCSDIGGSTRMPAFFCGLFGHNPTAGYTSMEGSVFRSGKDDTMASIGFVSKHCSDLAPLTSVVLVPRDKPIDLDTKVDIKTLKYFYVERSEDLRVSPICKDLRDAMKKVLAHFRASELGPTPYSHPGLSHMYSLWRHCMTKETEVFAEVVTGFKGRANALQEIMLKLIGKSEHSLAVILKLMDDQILPPVNQDWADALLHELKEDLLSKLGADGVLLFPAAPLPASPHYSAFARPFNFAYWGVLNALRLPATQVPLGLNSEGLPLGIQVVAAPRRDALCLAVAKHLEETFGGFVPPCKVY